MPSCVAAREERGKEGGRGGTSLGNSWVFNRVSTIFEYNEYIHQVLDNAQSREWTIKHVKGKKKKEREDKPFDW